MDGPCTWASRHAAAPLAPHLRRHFTGPSEHDVAVPPLFKTALVWGMFMGLSSNLRYQVVFGLERLVDMTIARKVPQVGWEQRGGGNGPCGAARRLNRGCRACSWAPLCVTGLLAWSCSRLPPPAACDTPRLAGRVRKHDCHTLCQQRHWGRELVSKPLLCQLAAMCCTPSAPWHARLPHAMPESRRRERLGTHQRALAPKLQQPLSRAKPVPESLNRCCPWTPSPPPAASTWRGGRASSDALRHNAIRSFHRDQGRATAEAKIHSCRAMLEASAVVSQRARTASSAWHRQLLTQRLSKRRLSLLPDYSQHSPPPRPSTDPL